MPTTIKTATAVVNIIPREDFEERIGRAIITVADSVAERGARVSSMSHSTTRVTENEVLVSVAAVIIRE